MGSAEIIGGIIAIAKDLPIVDRWLQQLMLAYAQARIRAWDKSIYNGIKKAIEENDQRELEEAIGNPGAGLPSGNPGTVIKPSPWVP